MKVKNHLNINPQCSWATYFALIDPTEPYLQIATLELLYIKVLI